MPDPSASRVTLGQVLAVYAESLVGAGKVVVVGDATDGLGARLVDLGARVVHVYDPDAARAAAAFAPRGVSIRALPDGDFDVRDGAFDLAIVPDLAVVADPAALLARVRRVVGDGVAIVATRNPDAADDAPSIDYFALFDMVSLQFACVRMLGQVAFRGVTIAELGDGDGAPQVSVDTQLVDDAGPPEAFVALAAQRDVRLEPYAIVQLPSDRESAPRDDERVTTALAEAQVRAEVLSAQLEEQRALARDVEARAGDNHVRAERLGHDLRALEEELQRQRDRAVRLARDLEEEKKTRTKLEIELGMVRRSPELAAARSRASELEEALRAAEVVVQALQARVVEVEDVANVATAAAQQLPDLIAELEATRAVARAGEEAAHQLVELAERAELIEERARQYEAELARRGAADADELAQLEEALRERGRAIQALEREVHRRERMVQELVGTLDEVHANGVAHAATFHEPAQVPAARMADEENAELRRKLDALATDVARREADAQAAAWRIAELEQAVGAVREGAQASASAARAEGHDARALEAALAAAKDEIDVLKQALAQEHDARKRSDERLRLVDREHDALNLGQSAPSPK